jgi:hypothetical protein
MIHLIKRNTRCFQTIAYCQRRETCTMLFSIEPLFFTRSDELPVFDDTGGGITVIRVDSQNVQADNSSPAGGDWIYFEMARNLLPSSLR